MTQTKLLFAANEPRMQQAVRIYRQEGVIVRQKKKNALGGWLCSWFIKSTVLIRII